MTYDSAKPGIEIKPLGRGRVSSASRSWSLEIRHPDVLHKLLAASGMRGVQNSLNVILNGLSKERALK